MLVFLAALSMLAGHFNDTVLFHLGDFSRVLLLVSRFAAPVFAVGVGVGLDRTSDLWAYFVRLLVCAVVSVVPHLAAFFLYHGSALPFSIVWLFAGCAFFAWGWFRHPLLGVLCFLPLFLAVPSLEYGIPCVLVVFSGWCWSVFLRSRDGLAFFAWLVSAFVGLVFFDAPVFAGVVALAGLLAFLVPVWPVLSWGKYRLGRRFFYWFYPLHLSVLALLAGVV